MFLWSLTCITIILSHTSVVIAIERYVLIRVVKRIELFVSSARLGSFVFNKGSLKIIYEPSLNKYFDSISNQINTSVVASLNNRSSTWA